MKKVLIIGSLAESLINFRGDLIAALVRKKFKVIACAPDASETIQRQLNEIGARYCDLNMKRTSLNPLTDLLAIFDLFITCLKHKPDIVIGYTIKPVLYGSLAAWMAGVPNIYTLITGLGYLFTGKTRQKSLLGRALKILYRFILKKNNLVFFQNPDDRSFFLTSGFIESHESTALVNGSGINLKRFPVQPLPEKPAFLMIARLIRDKGIHEYISAAKQLKEKYPDTRFSLVGWRDQNPASITEQELKALKTSKTVTYLGKLEDVRPAIAQSSVYVLPSYREGTPRTVLEAMAMGRAVITTDVPGCRETVVHGRNGVLVPHKDAPALAKAMEDIVLHPEKIHKMGKQSRTIAEQKYDVNKVNNAIITHILKTLKQPLN